MIEKYLDYWGVAVAYQTEQFNWPKLSIVGGYRDAVSYEIFEHGYGFEVTNRIAQFSNYDGWKEHLYPVSDFPPVWGCAIVHLDHGLLIIGGVHSNDETIYGVTPIYEFYGEDFPISRHRVLGIEPSTIYNHSAFYDKARHAVVVLGGVERFENQKDVPNSRVWIYDLRSRTWEVTDLPGNPGS